MTLTPSIPGGHLLPSINPVFLDMLGLSDDPTIIGHFEGYGGLTMGLLHALGRGHLQAYTEIEPSSIRLLERHHPGVPNLGDVSKVDWSPWAGRVEVAGGGFPCQDVSVAGLGAGMHPGTRSGLWYEFARMIAETHPKLVVIENVPGLRSTKAGASAEEADNDEHEDVEDGRDLEPVEDDLGFTGWVDRPVLRALGAVLGDLATLGYAATWGSFRASNVGAPHRRERVFIFAAPID